MKVGARGVSILFAAGDQVYGDVKVLVVQYSIQTSQQVHHTLQQLEVLTLLQKVQLVMKLLGKMVVVVSQILSQFHHIKHQQLQHSNQTQLVYHHPATTTTVDVDILMYLHSLVK